MISQAGPRSRPVEFVPAFSGYEVEEGEVVEYRGRFFRGSVAESLVKFWSGDA